MYYNVLIITVMYILLFCCFLGSFSLCSIRNKPLIYHHPESALPLSSRPCRGVIYGSPTWGIERPTCGIERVTSTRLRQQRVAVTPRPWDPAAASSSCTPGAVQRAAWVRSRQRITVPAVRGSVARIVPLHTSPPAAQHRRVSHHCVALSCGPRWISHLASRQTTPVC